MSFSHTLDLRPKLSHYIAIGIFLILGAWAQDGLSMNRDFGCLFTLIGEWSQLEGGEDRVRSYAAT
jgi:hypothetical protein